MAATDTKDYIVWIRQDPARRQRREVSRRRQRHSRVYYVDPGINGTIRKLAERQAT